MLSPRNWGMLIPMGYKAGCETRNKIYRAALRLFTRFGYYRTTMRMIAAEAEVNLGLCHYYFKKKENIAKNFYHQYHDYVRDFVGRKFSPADPFREFWLILFVNQILLFESRLLMTLYLEGVTLDDLLLQFSGPLLRRTLEDRMLRPEKRDDQWFETGAVIFCSSGQALLRKWREKKDRQGKEEVSLAIFRQLILYFGLDEEETLAVFQSVREETLRLDVEGLEAELLRQCLEAECPDSYS